MKPHLYSLILGAGGAAGTASANLDLGLGAHNAIDCCRALLEFGEDEHASRLFRSARGDLRRLRENRHRQAESYPQRQEKGGAFHYNSDACFPVSSFASMMKDRRCSQTGSPGTRPSGSNHTLDPDLMSSLRIF